MDRAQLLNDSEEAFRLAFDGRQSCLWTALPCIIESVDFSTMTLSAQPAIQGSVEDETGKIQTVNLPLLVDVPIVFPGSKDFLITFPLAQGDEVLVVFSSRCIDAWWQSGGIQRPMESRMHDLSDGFAIPGPRSKQNVTANISTTALQIRGKTGTPLIELAANGKIGVQNSTTSLLTILSDLESALSTFMTTLSAFSGGGSPVTQAMLQAPAATAASSLATVLTKIGALLK